MSSVDPSLAWLARERNKNISHIALASLLAFAAASAQADVNLISQTRQYSFNTGLTTHSDSVTLAGSLTMNDTYYTYNYNSGWNFHQTSLISPSQLSLSRYFDVHGGNLGSSSSGNTSFTSTFAVTSPTSWTLNLSFFQYYTDFSGLGMPTDLFRISSSTGAVVFEQHTLDAFPHDPISASGVLAPGIYTVLFSQSDYQPGGTGATWSDSFTLNLVPAPSSTACLGLLLTLVGLRRRGSRRVTGGEPVQACH